jgi:hypothetical protein
MWRRSEEDRGGSAKKESPSEGGGTQRKSVNFKDQEQISIPISRLASGGDSLLIKGEVDGKACNLTLDTGATRTIVRTDLIKDGIKPMEGFKLQTATRDSAMINGQKEVGIRIGNKQFRHQVIVADIVDEVILGMDFMGAKGFVLDLGQRTMSYGNVKLPLQISSGEPIVRRLMLDHRNELPPTAKMSERGNLNEGRGMQALRVVYAGEMERSVIEVKSRKALVKSENNYVEQRRTPSLTNNSRTRRRRFVESRRLSTWNNWRSLEEEVWILFGTNRFGRRVVLRTGVTSMRIKVKYKCVLNWNHPVNQTA